jgi:transposase
VGPVTCNDPTHADLLGMIQRLAAEVAAMKVTHAAETAALRAEIADLKAKLGRNSSNSSRPPSSDSPFAKLKRPSTPSGKKQGGQPGHPGSQRLLLDVGAVKDVVPHFPEICSCGHELPPIPDGDPIREQIWEAPQIKPDVTEHQFHAVVCPKCKKRTVATRGPEMPKGSFGPRAEATAVYFMGAGRLSVMETKRVFADLLCFPISTGGLKRIALRASNALAPCHVEALDAVLRAGVVHADETPWYLRGALIWLWLAATEKLKVFHVDPRRTIDACKAFLGETVQGTLVSDRYVAYAGQPADRHQLCLCHLARDAQALVDRGGRAKTFGTKFAAALEELFKQWREFEDVHHDRALLHERVQPTREAIVDLLDAGAMGKDDRVAEFSAYLLKKAESMFTFTEVEGCPPTNNLSEQSLRKPVMWRRACFGSQSDSGCLFVERILTVVESLRAQGRDVHAFLVEAMSAASQGRAPPSLMPTPVV